MSLHVIGISHRTADAEARAASCLTPDQVRGLLAEAARQQPGLEAVALVTCNRTEFYLAGPDAVTRWNEVLASACPAAPAGSAEQGWYAFEGPQAFQHLLRVACGLDSLLLGDGQVLGQLRRALSAAQQAGTLGGVLSPALAAALRTGRRARAETGIGQGAPGVGPAVAEALRARHVPADAEVLVLGAGDAARLSLRALSKAGWTRLAVANRTAAHAESLGREFGARLVAWDQVAVELARVAVAVVATGASRPVVTELPARRSRLLIVDAGFPAQVAGGLAGAETLSLDALTAAGDAAASLRRRAVPEVEALIHEQVLLWRHEQDRAPLERAIKSLHREAARHARDAAATLVASAGPLAPALDVQEVERLLARSVKALLHDHVTQLRALHPRQPSPLS